MRYSKYLLLIALGVIGCDEGPAGPAGSAGTDGVNGIDGVDGADGQNGSQNIIIDSDTTWSGTQTFSGIVEIVSGVTVTVEAGTELLMEPLSILTVSGSLNFQGTETEPILVAPAGADSGSAIRYLADADASSSLQFAKFVDVDLYLEGDNVTEVLEIDFENSGVRVRGRTEALLLDSCNFVQSIGRSGTGLYINDSTNVTVANSAFRLGTYGIQFNAGEDDDQLSVVGTYFEGQKYGIRTGVYTPEMGIVSVESSQFVEIREYGIASYNSRLNVSQTDIVGPGAYGIYADQQSVLTFSESFVDGFSRQCIRINGTEQSSISGSEISNCGGDGVYAAKDLMIQDTVIDGTGGDCVDANGDSLIIEESTLRNCGGDGVEANTSVSIINTLINTTGAYGIDAQDLHLEQSSVLNAGSDGVYVRGSAISEVTKCNVESSGGYGIRGYTSGLVQLDIVGNNIVGNEKHALYEVQLVSGNYIAGNNGIAGVDDTEGGTLDGSRTTDTAQIADADFVERPELERIPTAGVSE